jgi:hypothetical protein
MKKNISLLILVIGVLSLVGCSKDTVSPKDTFVKEEKTQFIVGNVEDHKKLIYTYNDAKSQKTRKVIFYIDQFPYKRTFDLCPELKNETNKVVREGKNKYIYTSKPGTCPGYINILRDPNSDELLVSYKITLLTGYTINKHHVKFPYRFTEKVDNERIQTHERAVRTQLSYWEYLED